MPCALRSISSSLSIERPRWSASSTVTSAWSSPPASTGCAAPTFGVSRFGQVRSLDDVYRYYGNDTDNNVTAALDILP
ncbi:MULTISPECIES: hypothetical protein [Rhodococcus]|jgi:pyruvate dehydrogenase complex dehydrogenase (E1) component|uniref:hypothetical protein n=1 Tax=Rhodococcus TaxID=1827 RepID=UPI00351F1BA1